MPLAPWVELATAYHAGFNTGGAGRLLVTASLPHTAASRPKNLQSDAGDSSCSGRRCRSVLLISRGLLEEGDGKIRSETWPGVWMVCKQETKVGEDAGIRSNGTEGTQMTVNLLDNGLSYEIT